MAVNVIALQEYLAHYTHTFPHLSRQYLCIK